MIDRGVYEIAALYDPAAPPSPFTDEPGWNGKLVYTFGGGCNVGYHQGQGNGGVLTDLFLARGYAVASSSLNVYDNNCSEVISAEVALMVKEHFAETYGKPVYTIGWGGSGGAIQQHLIGNNYPGILDGIVPGVSFQDSITLGTVPDCRLLVALLRQPGRRRRGLDGRAARCGLGLRHVQLVPLLAPRLREPDERARGLPDGAVPVSARYNPVTNPGGIKCTSFEQIATQLGRNPGERLRLAAARQHRPPVRAHRAPERGDHARAVRLAERERRRLRLHRPGRAAARRRRPDRDRARRTRPVASTRAGSAWRRRRSSTPARTPTSRRRHPHARALVRDAAAAPGGERHVRRTR